MLAWLAISAHCYICMGTSLQDCMSSDTLPHPEIRLIRMLVHVAAQRSDTRDRCLETRRVIRAQYLICRWMCTIWLMSGRIVCVYLVAKAGVEMVPSHVFCVGDTPWLWMSQC